MTHLVLLEDAPEGFVPDPGDRLVALTPVAVAALDRLGLSHEVAADIASEAALAALEDGYWEAQLDWFRAFGAALAATAPAAVGWRPGLPLAYHFFLKTALDSVFIRGFELRALLETGCSTVTLWHQDIDEGVLDTTLTFSGKSLHSRLLPRFADAVGVAWELRPVPVRRPAADSGLSAPAMPSERVGAALGRVAGLASSPRPGRKTFVFMSTMYDAYELHRRARRRGHRCLLFHEGMLVDLGGVRSRAVFDLSAPAEPWTVPADELTRADSSLWDWPASWHGITMTDVLAPRIHFFVEQVAPALVARAARFRAAIEALGVDFVCYPQAAQLNEAAAAGAARSSAGARAVMLDHGDMVFAPKEADIGFLLCSDLLFVANEETAAYYRKRAEAYPEHAAEVRVGSYRWAPLARLRRARSRRPGGRPLLVYVVTASGGDLRYLNSAWYSDAWYYRLQKRLVATLAAQSAFDVVVKDFPPGALNIENPIGEYARSLGAGHVTVSTLPFREWLPVADRVVVDFPSTALYECALAGVPCLGLLYEHFKARESALEAFGPTLLPFRNEDEAAALVERFVAEPAWPTLDFALPHPDLLTTLERL